MQEVRAVFLVDVAFGCRSLYYSSVKASDGLAQLAEMIAPHRFDHGEFSFCCEISSPSGLVFSLPEVVDAMKRTIMALDVGTRRIGVAVSDREGRMALPLETVDAKANVEAVKRIVTLAEDYQIEEIVVGWPLDMQGREGRAVDRVRRVTDDLEAKLGDEVPIHRWDERMTTTAADRLLIDADVSRSRRKDAVDQVAATKILEGFLKRRSNTEDT